MTAGAFPFLFHGPSPDDWFDEPVHAWLLRFARAPSPSDRTSLAAAWERAAREHTRGLGADTRLPWLWSGEWALVPIRPGDRSRDTMRALFAAMQSMLRAAHAAAPLAEVIYAQAADVSSDSAWEAWTVEQSPLPTEAPPWPAEVVTHAKKSRKRSKAAPDASFEAAREQLRADVTAPKVASVAVEEDDEEEASPSPRPRPVAKKRASDFDDSDDESTDDSGDDDSGDSDGGDDDSGDESGDEETVTLPEPRGFPLRLVEVGFEEAEAAREKRDEDASKFDRSERLPDGTLVVETKRSKKDKNPIIALVSDGETIPTALTADRFYGVRAWSPSHRALLVASTDYVTLSAVPVDGSEARVVWNDIARDSLNQAHWLADDSVLVTHSRGASLYSPPPAGSPGGSHHAWSDEALALTADRRGLIACTSDDATVVRVIAPARGALRIAGEACVKTDGWCSIETLPDGIYLFDNERAYRVEGAAEAIDALLAAPDDAARFPEVPRTTSPEERADPARNTDADDCYNRGANAKEEANDALAERWYRRTVELAPKNAAAWHGLGHVLQRMKRDGDATPCLERALAEYDAQLAALTGDDDDDPDERNDLRFWRAAVLSRLRRRDEVLAELRATIPDGHRGNYFRRRITDEEDFEWLKSDEDFKALTAKVAKPKRAPKTAKKTAAKADDGDGDDGDDE